MEFKTNIMCGACIEKVSPVLNAAPGAGEWKVDTSGAQKVLTVTKENVNEAEVIRAIENAGYKPLYWHNSLQLD